MITGNALMACVDCNRQVSAQSAKLKRAEGMAYASLKAAKINADPKQTVTSNIKYSIGPDGQLYATGGTVTTTTRSSSAENKQSPLVNPLVGDIAKNDNVPKAGFADTRPATLADVLSNKLQLSPLEFALSFSEEFVDDIVRAEQSIVDGAVRSQETLHFRAAGGLASGLPQYGTEAGADGAFIATSGKVDIQSASQTDPAKAARDATTMAIAATAPGDASAQDFFVAKAALNDAAGFYRKAAMPENAVNLIG